jgi:hypothetical protein
VLFVVGSVLLPSTRRYLGAGAVTGERTWPPAPVETAEKAMRSFLPLLPPARRYLRAGGLARV